MVKVFIVLREPNSRLPEVRANLSIYTSGLCIKAISYIHRISIKDKVS